MLIEFPFLKFLFLILAFFSTRLGLLAFVTNFRVLCFRRRGLCLFYAAVVLFN